MPKQRSIIKITGSLDDLVFYNSIDGPLVRGKGRLNRERIRNDRAFERTREHNSEFGRASKAGKLLRKSQYRLLQRMADSRMHGRMLKIMMRVLKTDTENLRGERRVAKGRLEYLEGFDFNLEAPLANCLRMAYQLRVDRQQGKVRVMLPAFTAGNEVLIPQGCSHIRLVAACSEVDFEAGKRSGSQKKSPWLECGREQLSRELVMKLKTEYPQPVFTLLGVEFGQKVNEYIYQLDNSAYNALAVVGVEAP